MPVLAETKSAHGETVSPSICSIDIMLIVLNIKLYYNYHIKLTSSKEMRSKVRYTCSQTGNIHLHPQSFYTTNML